MITLRPSGGRFAITLSVIILTCAVLLLPLRETAMVVDWSEVSTAWEIIDWVSASVDCEVKITKLLVLIELDMSTWI